MYSILQLLFTISLVCSVFSIGYGKPDVKKEKYFEEKRTCGYDSCHPILSDFKGSQNEILNVHLIPHSHDDTGWLKTVDQYYLGSNRARFDGGWENQRVGVQYVLDSVIKELMFNPDRRFIQVETAFFWRWWVDQDERIKNEVKRLVENGQLEFILGGWCMNDEAAAHYTDIIHQMSLGMRFLNDTFGECGNPRVAWQIDPFGHSKEQANLFAEMGFDGLFLGRLDYRDKSRRMSTKEMEMIWYSNKNQSQSLFTGINYNIYAQPPGFCWDLICNDEPLVDDIDSHSYNLDTRIPDFIDYVWKQAESYQTNNIALTMGEDFQYSAAHSWFTNLDRLIKHVNSGTNEHGVHLLYSTPSCYLKALQEDKSVSEWPTKNDDFFPYASDEHGYWTGYFTSRPTSKRMIRESSGVLNSAKQLISKSVGMKNEHLSSFDCNIKDTLEDLGHAIAVTQHHDAVTGTEKQYVTEDYHIRLDQSVQNFLKCAGEENSPIVEVGKLNCPLLNISQCDVTESRQSFYVSVYNPLPRIRSWPVRLPIPTNTSVTVSKKVGGICLEDIQTQIHPIPIPVLSIPGRNSTATNELTFIAESLLPLQHDEYCVVMEFDGPKSILDSNSIDNDINEFPKVLKSSNGNLFHFDTTSKNSIRLQKRNKNGRLREIEFTQKYFYYTGYDIGNRPSGAYTFRPNEVSPNPLGDPTTSKTFSGNLFHEIHQTFHDESNNQCVSQVIRIPRENVSVLYDAEIEWLVGPIPIENNKGKEYIHRIHVDGLENQGLYYTDSNGRQFLERKRNFRPDFDVPDVDEVEPVTSNYYPVTSGMYIEDSDTKLRLTVLTDRSQGGGSISDNELELMLHRRLLVDDHWGVGEALNETAFGEGLVARGKHYLLFDFDKDEAFRRYRMLANELYAQPLITFDASDEKNKPPAFMIPKTTVTELPPNVNLLTLEPIYQSNDPIQTDSFLLRFEHIFDVDEHEFLSLPAVVPLKKFIEQLFGAEIVSIEETTLGGDRLKEASIKERFQWNSNRNEKESKLPSGERAQLNERTVKDFEEIELKPMEMRTFIIVIN